VSSTVRPRPLRNGPALRPRWLANWYGRQERTALGLIGLAGFFLLWELGSRSGLINPFFFSSPLAVVAAGVVEVQLPRFWGDLGYSAFEFAAGYLGAIALAVPLGIAIGWYRRLAFILDPWLNFFNSLPRIALLPLIVLWLGLGLEAKIAVVFLGAFFSIIVPTVQGIRTVDRRYLDVARSFGASQWRLFASVVIPSTIPFIVAGLRLGIGRALTGVIVAELYAQTEGLGVMISRASAVLQVDRMLFGVFVFTLAGVLGVEALRRVERHIERWRPVREVF
jgi:NitT/TauT family transport system permease protein